MAALPYIQLYVADYLADTMHLSTEEHGAYLLLIMNYWQTGKPIPKNRLASIARLSNDRWKSVEDSLKEFFTEGERGEWIHKRLELDLAKVKAKSSQASRAGKASAAKRAASRTTDSKGHSNGRYNGRSNSAERKSNHTDTDKDTDIDKSNSVEAMSVFNYWCRVMNKGPGTRMTDGRRRKILGRLKNGYSVDDIKKAIDNCSRSPHNMGHNDRKTLYNDIELICRSDDKLEYFRDQVGQGSGELTARDLLNGTDWANRR